MATKKQSSSITSTTCPCGSGNVFKNCCSPLLDGRSHAATPEQLMRSRYTAYTQRNTAYILQTWDYSSKPATISLDNDSTIWLGLEIHEAPIPEQEASNGSVNFTARSIQNGKQISMREESRFVKRNGYWYYLDGKMHITEQSLSLKSPCPCGSGKKFKRCCAGGTR